MGVDRSRRRDARTRDIRAPDAGEATLSRFAAPLASTQKFYGRVLRGASWAFGLVAATLAIGMIGYHSTEHLGWLDAFHQSAMLLSGEGPVVNVTTTAGKLFDGIYALFCGVVLLASVGLLFAPVIHRILHRFHIEDARDR